MKSKIELLGDKKFIDSWKKIEADYKKQEKLWVKTLKKKGIRASHPDDGWVDRENNEVYFCYPQFDDGVKVGDLIALGWASEPKEVRIVKVIKIRKGIFSRGNYYQFKPVKKWYEFWK